MHGAHGLRVLQFLNGFEDTQPNDLAGRIALSREGIGPPHGLDRGGVAVARSISSVAARHRSMSEVTGLGRPLEDGHCHRVSVFQAERLRQGHLSQDFDDSVRDLGLAPEDPTRLRARKFVARDFAAPNLGVS